MTISKEKASEIERSVRDVFEAFWDYCQKAESVSSSELDVLMGRNASCLVEGSNGYTQSLYHWDIHTQTERPVSIRITIDKLFVFSETAALTVAEVECVYQDPGRVVRFGTTFNFVREGDNWRIAHAHISILDSAIETDDSSAVHELRKRNSELEQAIAARTEELKRSREELAQRVKDLSVESSLERIRNRTMAMSSSNELAHVIALIFSELRSVGFDALACDLVLFDRDTGNSTMWLSGSRDAEKQDSFPIGYRIPKMDHPHYTAALESWKSGEKRRVTVLKGSAYVSYMESLLTRTEMSNLPEPVKRFITERQGIVHSEIFNTYGCIRVASETEYPEAKLNILTRFAEVFDETYTRFVDLQRLEMQAREANRRASLDRLRAEIASMRTAADLNHVTPLIWRELKILEIPFFRCGVFIIDPEKRQLTYYLSDPKGNPLATLTIPFEAPDFILATVDHWKNGTVLKVDWTSEQFTAWSTYLLENGLIQNEDEYLGGTLLPEKLSIHLVPFAQGMLYVGSSETLSDDQLAIVQSLAEAFSVAYARYEDFQELEANNEALQNALNDLNRTQEQLLHAEKLASLGELTAGIAHEIKNPLNFINNFADLNAELADEIAEMLEAGEPVDDVLEDLKRNAAVIAQHGKRADGIVRSMMSHARGGEGERRDFNLNHMVDEYVDLAYHGMRARVPDFNAQIERTLGETVGNVHGVAQDLGRVLLNLVSNAFDALYEHSKTQDNSYMPTLWVETRRNSRGVEMIVSDNAGGIPPAVCERIFEPFFTTKPSGSGTGLGLSLSHDIIQKGHQGTLEVNGQWKDGTRFTVFIPDKRL